MKQPKKTKNQKLLATIKHLKEKLARTEMTLAASIQADQNMTNCISKAIQEICDKETQEKILGRVAVLYEELNPDQDLRPATDVWIPWDGGPNPLEQFPEALVKIRMRNGTETTCGDLAKDLTWHHGVGLESHLHIVEYNCVSLGDANNNEHNQKCEDCKYHPSNLAGIPKGSHCYMFEQPPWGVCQQFDLIATEKH